MSRGNQRGQIRHRTAAEKQTAGRVRKSANSAKPANDSQFHRCRRRSAQPSSVENVEAGRKRVRHRAHKIVRSRNESEKPRMIDMQIVRKNVALELGEKIVRIAPRLRRILIEQRHHSRRIGFCADRSISHVRKMLHQKIDNLITKLAHLITRKRNAGTVSGRIVHCSASISSPSTSLARSTRLRLATPWQASCKIKTLLYRASCWFAIESF